MKTIVYNPVKGEVWPDSEIEVRASHFLNGTEDIITTGSELFCHYARALYQNNDYGVDLYFDYNKESFKVLKDGRLKYWPQGFCDYYDNVLEMLL